MFCRFHATDLGSALEEVGDECSGFGSACGTTCTIDRYQARTSRGTMLPARPCAFMAILTAAAAVGIQLPLGFPCEDVESRLRFQRTEDFKVISGFSGTRITYWRNRNKYTLTYYRNTAYLKIDGRHELLFEEGRELQRLLGGTLADKKGSERDRSLWTVSGTKQQQCWERTGAIGRMDVETTTVASTTDGDATSGTGQWDETTRNSDGNICNAAGPGYRT